MLRFLWLSLFYFLYNVFNEDDTPKYTSLEKTFPLHWKTDVGSASFRSNIEFDNKYIFFPSNGSSFKDATLFDSKGGLYVLERTTGKKIKQIGGGMVGDLDVNGVVQYNGKLFFGNDNDEFFCSSKDGKILWRNLTSGDIEHEPVLMKVGNKIQIVYATEAGEVSAVDPNSGKRYWSYYTPDFEGWKPGENKFSFKIGGYFKDNYEFFTKPIVADVSGDGIEDLTYLTNSSRVYSINGKTGKLIWMQDNLSDQKGKIISNLGSSTNPIFGIKEAKDRSSLHSYWQLIMLDKMGKELKSDYLMEFEYWGESLNVLKTSDLNTIICLKDTVKIYNKEGIIDKFSRGISFRSKEFYESDTKLKSRNDSESLIAQALFTYKSHTNCILILNQNDMAYKEKGLLQIVSLDEKKLIECWEIPSTSEFQPVIQDVNLDGKPDLLISGHDGFLYCFNLGNSFTDIKYCPKFNY